MAIRISCEGETALEVLSHIKGFAALISPDVPAKLRTLSEDTDAPVDPAPVPSAHAPQAPVARAAAPSAPAPQAPAVAPIIPAAPTAPITAPAAPPVAPAPTYTYEQVGKAGAALVAANPHLMPALGVMLQKYGAQAVTDLKPEQLGAVAAELRAMGAAI